MNRRELLRKLIEQTTALASASLACGCTTRFALDTLGPLTSQPEPRKAEEKPAAFSPPQDEEDELSVRKVSSHQHFKTQHFDQTHADDIFVSAQKYALLESCVKKLRAMKNYIGYSHFNLLSFDELLHFCKTARGLEALSHNELVFFEEIFYFDAKKYGFYGAKVSDKINHKITAKEVAKIPGSGHYLFTGEALTTYQRLKKDIGPSLILTSGVRNIVKQLQLFLEKAVENNGNLSLASRSLAPPGHSYHIAGDFDVGKAGLGPFNFTDRFSQTPEYKKLLELGYIAIRYPTGNPFGVRFEPWHIEGRHRNSHFDQPLS